MAALLFLVLAVTGCQRSHIHGVVMQQGGRPVDGATVVIAVVNGKHLSVPSGGLQAALTHNGGVYSLVLHHENSSIYRITVTADNFEPVSRIIDTHDGTEADMVLIPSVIYKRTYQPGEEVQVRDLEWCPARVIVANSNSYKIEYLNGAGTLEVPPERIRPADA